MRRFTLILLLFISGSLSAAPVETYIFDSPEMERSFHRLSDELRCLVCQNQNIAESNAELAQDLRKEIYTMLMDGQTEDEIVDFMVARYGDYVLYRPPFKPMTWLLWLGPTLIFFAGIYIAWSRIRSQSDDVQSDLSEHDRERLRSLQEDNGERDPR